MLLEVELTHSRESCGGETDGTEASVKMESCLCIAGLLLELSFASPAVPGQYINSRCYRKILGSYSLTFLTPPHIYNTHLAAATEKGQPLHRSHHGAKGSRKPPSLLPPQLNTI